MTKKELKKKVRDQEVEIAKLQGKVEGLQGNYFVPWYDYRVWYTYPWSTYPTWTLNTGTIDYSSGFQTKTGFATLTTTGDISEVESMNL